MKIKILLLISLVSVAFLAMVALCADWDNQENLNADLVTRLILRVGLTFMPLSLKCILTNLAI